MNLAEKKNILIANIEHERSKLKNLLIETVKIYGGQVEPHLQSKKTYTFQKYEEGEFLSIDSFVLLKETELIVAASTIDSSYEFPAEEFDIVDLANWMFSMIEDGIRILQQKINKLSDEYIRQNHKSPKYAKCDVYFLDSGDWYPVKVKLSSDLDEDDDSVFFYFNSLDALKNHIPQSGEDFIITDIHELI